MITEDYVSFETAKLLKEKGFEQHKCQHSYDSKGVFKWSDNLDPYEYSAPTHQMAMKWLREKHDLHIIAYPFKSGNDTVPKHWCCYVYKTFNLLGHERYFNETLNSYEEAVEAALKYSLENLLTFKIKEES